VAAALAEAGEDEDAGLAAWLRGDARAPAALRLDVYANAYFARLLGVLREDFPALAAALGELAFHDLVTAYLIACPPGSFTLRDAGERLPAFLSAGSAEAAFFRVRWPYAADLARFEWALVDAFDAPDAPALRREELAALSPGGWDGLALSLHPASALFALDWPVERLREAFDEGSPLPLEGFPQRPTRLLVSRSGDWVRFRALEADEAALLDAVARGSRFGLLCGRLAERVPEAEAAPRAAALLTRWTLDGVLAA
jgi:hypothetical protein